tara:strand:+ start:213 stop:683 length:471 start_codon:yes stop_codon:yes gene_type:complete
VVEKIKQWILNFVSQHHSTLEHIPCPFAKQALITNKINFIQTTTVKNTVKDVCDNWSDDYEVVCVYFDEKIITTEQLSKDIEELNEYSMPKDIVSLEDHPDDVEIVNGVQMNFGLCGIVLIQRLSKLNKASKILRKQGYYKNWSKQNLEDVVEWRT